MIGFDWLQQEGVCGSPRHGSPSEELVAREIHGRSAREGGPLVRVNSASIHKELFESEFFDDALTFEAARCGSLRQAWMPAALNDS